MIVINRIEELIPYAKYVEAKYTNGEFSYLKFEIEQDGELQDVTFNCGAELNFSFDNVLENIFGVEDLIANDEYAESCEVRLVAKDIYTKTNFACEVVECENFYFDDKVDIDFLTVKHSVKGNNINARCITCEYLDVDTINCDDFSVVDFNARFFIHQDVSFECVSFHNPTFVNCNEKSWELEKFKTNFYSYHQRVEPF